MGFLVRRGIIGRMSVAAPTPSAVHSRRVALPRLPGLWFACGFLGIAILAAAFSGLVPIEFSIATVFLFAGPAQLARGPLRPRPAPGPRGKLWGFFAVSAVGIVGLTAAFAAIPWLTARRTTPRSSAELYAVWNTTFLFWVAALVWMRSRTNPRFDGGLGLAAGVSDLRPASGSTRSRCNVALIYLHPLMALWLLDRELARSRPALAADVLVRGRVIPLFMAASGGSSRDAPNLTGTTVHVA